MDAINSVQLSNHTGYKSFKGQILQGEDICEFLYPLHYADSKVIAFNTLLISYSGTD